MQHETKLGQLIDSTAGRDAIHIAVAPMVAPCFLTPGQRVDKDGQPYGEHVGIVDPFLTAPVEQGQRFYICLFPGTITGLRHVWMHPAFQRAT